jgi:hypothetical protein
MVPERTKDQLIQWYVDAFVLLAIRCAINNNAVQPIYFDSMTKRSSAMQEYQTLDGGQDASFDVRVLGVRCGSNLDELGFALVNYRLRDHNDLLQVEHLRVSLLPISWSSALNISRAMSSLFLQPLEPPLSIRCAQLAQIRR